MSATLSLVSPALSKPCDSCNAADFLLEGKLPNRPALWLLDRQYSFGELQAASTNVARLLLQHGQKGDRVLLAGDNSFFWVASYLGTLLAGMVSIPLAPVLPVSDLRHIVTTTEPRFACVPANIAVGIAEIARDIRLITDHAASKEDPMSIGAAQFLSDPHHGCLAFPRVAPGDLAALMFTSGSTGTPRGVMISHRNIVANTGSIIKCLEIMAEDRMMTVLPFHYCFGTSLLHTHLRAGAMLVCDRRFLYPEKVIQRMNETACTGFAGVPSHYQILLRRSNLARMKLPHLRCLQQAGGHLAPAFVRELRTSLPETRIFIMYGQTEATARLACLAPEYLDRKPGSIGKAIPGVTLRVVNEAGRDVRPGETGEIVAEGENIALGYWRDPDESAAAFRGGKLHTGDLATIDDDGFIYIVGRARDFIKCGGKRISCRQIEEQLLEFDGLIEAAVIGTPDPILGEAVKAFVVPREPKLPGLEHQLVQFCREHLPLELHPKSLVFLAALPKNSAGKVLKANLRAL